MSRTLRLFRLARSPCDAGAWWLRQFGSAAASIDGDRPAGAAAGRHCGACAIVAPMPPPPPASELVPPPPQGSGPVVWQPGHWAYTGVPGHPWSWVSGQYVTPPPGGTTWTPGSGSRLRTDLDVGRWALGVAPLERRPAVPGPSLPTAGEIDRHVHAA